MFSHVKSCGGSAGLFDKDLENPYDTIFDRIDLKLTLKEANQRMHRSGAFEMQPRKPLKKFKLER